MPTFPLVHQSLLAMSLPPGTLEKRHASPDALRGEPGLQNLGAEHWFQRYENGPQSERGVWFSVEKVLEYCILYTPFQQKVRAHSFPAAENRILPPRFCCEPRGEPAREMLVRSVPSEPSRHVVDVVGLLPQACESNDQ